MSLQGLEGLASIGGISVSLNPSLQSLDGLNNLVSVEGTLSLSVSSPALTSLEALQNLESAGGIVLGVEALSSLGGLSSLSEVTGRFAISGTSVATLEGLESLVSVGDDFSITSNDELESLAGLEGITTLNRLEIIFNGGMQSLSGLQNMSSVDTLIVAFNNSLAECRCGLAGLISGDPPAFSGVSGSISVQSNAPDGQCNSPQAVLDASCEPTTNEPSAVAPSSLRLTATYPNPTRGSVTAVVATTERSPIRLALYDLQGREVALVYDGTMYPGERTFSFDSADLAAGVYLLRLESPEGIANSIRVVVSD